MTHVGAMSMKENVGCVILTKEFTNKQRNKSMVGNYEVITLCGSTRFKEQFFEQQKRLTLEGKIVVSVGCFGHSGDVFTDEQKIMLDDMHKRKIDMADGIFVINVGGYIGSSTRSEIDYAICTGRRVDYLETPNTDFNLTHPAASQVKP